MSIIIEPLSHTTHNDALERRCVVIKAGEKTGQQRHELWYQFPQETTLPDDNDCDAYLISNMLIAMKHNQSVHVKGSVSGTLLSNLVEYQSIWARWYPKTYSQVDVVCDHIRETEKKLPGAVCAFSGGVDASFSVWRHSQDKCSYRSQDIKSCAIVHGFDIPLDNERGFANAADAAEQTLRDLDLPLVRIKTNYRSFLRLQKLGGFGWRHTFLSALVAILNQLKSYAGTCVVGSAQPYDQLVFPHGSSPVSDHLLNSGDFGVVHDGASHSRLEKVDELTEWKAGVKNLRVCWEGELKDRNCGRCEKCVRTKLIFIAKGHEIPGCFPVSDILEDMRKIVIKPEPIRTEWRMVYEQAKANNVNPQWLRQIRAVINRRPLAERLLPEDSFRGKFFKRLMKKPRVS